MPALFSPRSNRIARRVLLALGGVAVGVPLLLMAWVRTPAVTGQGRSPVQPIRFDHRIHATGLRVDCRYCHDGAERAASAGLPATDRCVPCHSTLWLNSADFAPVRRSIETGRAIPWVRVNRVPGFVYFNHGIHAQGGVACASCHGDVAGMAQVEQAAPLTMSWCVNCHTDPEPHRRPHAAITAATWRPTAADPRPAPLSAARIAELTTCSACHR